MTLKINGNALKFIAMITMLIDHIGMIFYPNVLIFRIIGRIAFPTYAFLIAEGCRYTHNKKKYFLRIFILGIVYSIVFMIAEQYVYMCVLITFSFSILLIYLYDYVKQSFKKRWIFLFFAISMIYFFCSYIEVDYGFFGILVAFLIYLSNDKWIKVLLLFISLLLLSFSINNEVQIYSLISIMFIILYNGERGNLNLKHMFYLFYPVHLAILFALDLALSNYLLDFIFCKYC